MKAVIQRVTSASVSVDGEQIGSIGHGLVLLLGIAKGDIGQDLDYVVDRVVNLRIFSDAAGRMNRSLLDVQGALLVISQFTLLGSTSGGRRPGFEQAAPPDEARKLYEQVIERLHAFVPRVENGRFGAHMVVTLSNDGPVTFALDSRDRRPGTQASHQEADTADSS
ncbi:MAG: D-aminoacyl-tRNA deacylase [Nitrospiraceae bacterium]